MVSSGALHTHRGRTRFGSWIKLFFTVRVGRESATRCSAEELLLNWTGREAAVVQARVAGLTAGPEQTPQAITDPSGSGCLAFSKQVTFEHEFLFLKCSLSGGVQQISLRLVCFCPAPAHMSVASTVFHGVSSSQLWGSSGHCGNLVLSFPGGVTSI